MKRLEELKNGDIVWIYSILSFPDKEVVNKAKTKVYGHAKDYSSVSVQERYGTEYPARHILKMNEGSVYRNSLWLSEENDELAEELLITYLKRKIEIFEHDIELYRKRINLINEFFDKYKDYETVCQICGAVYLSGLPEFKCWNCGVTIKRSLNERAIKKN